MLVRLLSGTLNLLGGVRVGAVNFWERDGRFTAKLVLPDENLIVGVGDEFIIGEQTYRVEAMEKRARDGLYELMVDDPALVPLPKKEPQKEVPARMEESDFQPEDKVSCLFQSAPYELGGIQMGLSKFGNREGRLSASLGLRKSTQVVFEGDEFDIGLARFRLLKIQRTESGKFWEGFVQEVGPALVPIDPGDEKREIEEARQKTQARRKFFEDHTFEIKRRHYTDILDQLKLETPRILSLLTGCGEEFAILSWEKEESSKMHRDPREGDLGPNLKQTATAVFEDSDILMSIVVDITQWSPGNVANMSARVSWRALGKDLWCSLHCEKDGTAHKACVMGEDIGIVRLKEMLL